VHVAGCGDSAGDGGFYLPAYLVCLRQRHRSVEAAFYFQQQRPPPSSGTAGFLGGPARRLPRGDETNLTGYFLVAREITPRMLAAGGGRIVNISASHTTMHRAGFVPYGPSKAGSEALSRIMAADLRDTGVTVNLLLPGGATATGMLPPGAAPEGQRILEPAVMGPPIVWLASDEAVGVHDERIIATEFEQWLRDRKDGQ
jgi:NAD(P)-dependent dehydrogenase (short-subunit alcohol dehydrogenase family)